MWMCQGICQSYVTWLSYMRHESWLIHMRHDSFTCDTTHINDTWRIHITFSYETWLIHMRHDSFIWDMAHSYHPFWWDMIHSLKVGSFWHTCAIMEDASFVRHCTTMRHNIQIHSSWDTAPHCNKTRLNATHSTIVFRYTVRATLHHTALL